MSDALARVLAYHARTKHRPGRYAASLGYLDWASQPSPFRVYAGAEALPLARPLGDVLPDSPPYDALFVPGAVPAAAVDAAGVASLLYHALALSAWKQQGRARWSLRVNPSSGNLHPTEGYVLAGPIAGLSDAPGLYHYSPLLHALERRAALPADLWDALLPELGAGRVLVGLSSIAWREAWKYGERAFRYCNHDVGHAIAAIGLAAALHGWRARLLDGLTEPMLAALMGLGGLMEGPEAELPECLIAVTPGELAAGGIGCGAVAPELVARLAGLPLAGAANRLSEAHHDWPVIAEVAAASARVEAATDAAEVAEVSARVERATDATEVAGASARVEGGTDAAEVAGVRGEPAGEGAAWGEAGVSASAVIRGRRSAVAMDGRTGMTAAGFYDMLRRTLPGGPALGGLPWAPAIDLALLVHRVEGVDPGLYLLLRAPEREARWRAAADPGFAWTRPAGAPAGLRLLRRGDARRTAAFLSCGQDIAADGAFSLGMIADFRGSLERRGPAMYRRLFWEAGAIGQVLYLEAEAIGLSGTGIGCYFDDEVHALLGLRDDAFQSLYHFTVGGRVEDDRLVTLDPYHHLEARDA